MGDVIRLPPRASGNGAREALRKMLDDPRLVELALTLSTEDRVLGMLWELGFKIVPLDGDDK